MFWLGHALDAASYSALPAKSVPDAALLIMQLDVRIDVLVINPALPGGPDFIAALHRSQGDVRVIGIQKDANHILHVPGLDASHPKPAILNDAAKADWLQCVESVLTNDHWSQRSFH